MPKPEANLMMSGSKLIWIALLCAGVFLQAGCFPKSEAITLRFSPGVGDRYPYRFTIHHPLTPIELSTYMKVMSKDKNGFRLEFAGMENPLFSGQLTVTERHNSDHPGYISLNFPDRPVKPGDEWNGEIPWYYENYYVLDPTPLHLQASYRLLSVENSAKGRVAILEERIEADVAAEDLVFYVGQVGVQWDRDGIITNIHPDYDAHDQLMVGDVVVGVNGRKAAGLPGRLRLLAEEEIQRPRQNETVVFTVLRAGKELEIRVKKTVDQLAVVNVLNKQDHVTVSYDVDRGILKWVETSSRYQVVYRSVNANPFPVVDDYGGFHKFGFLKGLTMYEDTIDSEGPAWTLRLDE